MAPFILSLLILHALLISFSTGETFKHCPLSNCSTNGGPDIRFPFSLQTQCAFSPDFSLSCSKDNRTIIELPNSIKLTVEYIDYGKKTMRVSEPTCLLSSFSNLNLSASPFQILTNFYYNLSFFHCYNNIDDNYNPIFRTCLEGGHMYGAASDLDLDYIGDLLVSCKKVYANSSLPSEMFRSPYELILSWSKTDFGYVFNGVPKSHTADALRGLFLLVVIIIAAYCIVMTIKNKKADQKKIEKFLKDYRASNPARYTYADIKSITSKFKYNIGQGGFGTVYKGKLSNDVHVAVKILNNVKGNGDDFINEVKTIGQIRHINVVHLVGYCSDGSKKALIYEFLENQSLEKYISCGKEKQELGWAKLDSIAIGVAKGIVYLHQGCDKRILHFDIKPNNILLDRNFSPKVADFGLAKLCSKEQSAVSMTLARGTIGYIAPEVFSRNFGNVSYKSDVYSFGMLLLEMVGVRNKNKNEDEQGTSEVYFPEWIYSRINQGEELGIELDEGDEDAKRIAKKLTIVGLWCIQWDPMDRPSMKVVEQMLEGDGSGLAMPPNPFTSTIPGMVGSNVAESSSSFYTQSLETIVECESEEKSLYIDEGST